MSIFSINFKKAGNVALSTSWRHVGGVEVHMTPLILNLITGRTWVVNSTPVRFPARREHCHVLNRRLDVPRSWRGRVGRVKLESFNHKLLCYIKRNFFKKIKTLLKLYVPAYINYFLITFAFFYLSIVLLIQQRSQFWQYIYVLFVACWTLTFFWKVILFMNIQWSDYLFINRFCRV
jgi:hypothetical protein